MIQELEFVQGECQNNHFENFLKSNKCEYHENYNSVLHGLIAQETTHSSLKSYVPGFGILSGKV